MLSIDQLFKLMVKVQNLSLTPSQVAGSVTFKNYIKRNWAVTDEGGDKVHASDRDAVKTLIIDLMLKSPGPVQKQLSEAISIIGKQDFPERWQNLIPDMVSRFASGDFHIINGVLQTAHSIFEKYTVEFKSQKLWEEIKFVLDNFAKPLTELFTQTIDLAAQHFQLQHGPHLRRCLGDAFGGKFC